MENNVESEAAPPVSSLRSRWEAMSKKADVPDEKKEVKPSAFGSKISRSHKGEARPTTPTVVISPAPSSSAHNVPLKRVVSAPESQPTSPTATESSFATSKSSRMSQSNADGISAMSGTHGEEDDDDNPTPSAATPRKTPSTPSFSIGLADRGHSIGLGDPPGSSGGDRRSFSGPSTSSSEGSGPTRRRGIAHLLDKFATDEEDITKKLTRKPPPPPIGKKPPPPAPPPRKIQETSSDPSSRSATPSIELEGTRYGTAHLRSESTSSTISANLSPPPLPARGTPSPSLPPRSPAPLQSPALPPRSTEGPATENTVYHHQNRGFRTPSTEHLSPAGSDGSDNGKPSLVPPKLPSRPGNSSAPLSPASSSAPPLPRRSHPIVTALTEAANSMAPRLPPRGTGASAPVSLDDVVSEEIQAKRRVPPPPPQALRPRNLASPSPNGSRESLTPTDDASPPPPPSARATASDFLPPPSRTVPVSQDAHAGTSHHHHHFPHLPHQLSSLPMAKILAAVKMGGHSSGSRSPQGHTSPNVETSPRDTSELVGTAGLPPPPTRGFVERMAALRPHSSSGHYDQDDDFSSEEGDGQGSATVNGDVSESGGIKRPISKVGDDLPDTSRSNRRPPLLPEFQHSPAVYAPHHHPIRNSEGITGSELRVSAHSGVVAVAGWWVVIASPGVITVTDMNAAARERRSGGSMEEAEREMELAMGYAASSAGGGGSKGVWTIEMKEMGIEWKVDKPRVTAMEFRHGSSENSTPISRNASQSSFHQSPNGREAAASDSGRYIWCGTRDGCLFELDVWNGGKLTDVRVGAHTGHVTGIYRLPGNRMLTLDEHGKCLVFCGVGARNSGEEKSGVSTRCWLSLSNPRTHRILHKEGFARVLNGKLWTSPPPGSSSASAVANPAAAGSGESLSSGTLGSGASLSSLSQANAKPPRHHYHQHRHNARNGTTPTIRIHEVDEDGALITKALTVGYSVGAVTCGTVLPSTPGVVYLGHEGGWVTVWGSGEMKPAENGHGSLLRPTIHRHDSTSSFNSKSTGTSGSDDEEDHTDDETVAGQHATDSKRSGTHSTLEVSNVSNDYVCLRRVKISISDVISLEGVGSRLWAGTRKGLIYAYDVMGKEPNGTTTEDEGMSKDTSSPNSQRPWVATNVWRAHRELPVTCITVDPYSVAKTQKLVVYSIGRDEALHFWDGFLSQNWIDTQMLAREASFCTFRPLQMLICTWNIDAAKPDNLTGTNNVTFFQRFLAAPALEGTRPDIIVFGFQEVIDLEDKKLTAKTVLLGSGKKRTDGTISAKVSRHYRLWHDRLAAEVQRAYPSESYIVQHTENLVGLFTCIFVRRSVAHPTSTTKAVRDIAITTIKCGMNGMYGNKGAIVARFTLDDSSFCFLNCHLAAGQSQRVARNMDLAAILEEKSVFPASPADEDESSPEYLAYVGGGDGSMILDHELCFLNGDLNYRIEQRRDAVIANIQAGKLNHLLQYDQLLHELKTNPTFRLQTFTEPPITFAPTYKYDPHSDNYDTSEKRRIPAWCDRILYRSRDASRIENLWYGRYEPDISDHRPVCGAYRVVVKKVVPEKRAKELKIVKKLWEKEQVRLCAQALDFYIM
ncbi:hypothetical protein M408DRAFT_12984 [Serendipita vermifera MAFF 305830]|uniref:Inositol polyphosphate-related phosphatase domain-containing protein n=1 Tax=Serendipita vermifera MAFF 305830 TaxID=933852 RepID=A0A0C2W1U0_SERVB|nr:hypothetical protein M408DRAFT_12984 [Serendipita vermifera MAFF 305830]